MEIKHLKGGKLIQAKREPLQFPIYGDKPGFQVGAPGSIQGNVAMGVQMSEAGRLQFGNAQPVKVKVVIRETEGNVYILLAPVKEDGDDVYTLRFRKNASNAPTVSKLKPLFEEAGITLRRDVWYELDSTLVDDEEVRFAVAGLWTTATTTPRPPRSKSKVTAKPKKTGEEAGDDSEEEAGEESDEK